MYVIFAKLNINVDIAVSLSKPKYKQLIRKQIIQKNISDILEQSKTYKKIDFFEMKNEVFQMKPYLKTMKLADARTMFSIQMKTTRTIKSHFMSDKKFALELWKCPEKM